MGFRLVQVSDLNQPRLGRGCTEDRDSVIRNEPKSLPSSTSTRVILAKLYFQSLGLILIRDKAPRSVRFIGDPQTEDQDKLGEAPAEHQIQMICGDVEVAAEEGAEVVFVSQQLDQLVSRLLSVVFQALDRVL